MITLHPGWFTSAVNPVAHVLIIAAAVWVAWRNRDRRPMAAGLFLFAALLSLLDVVLRFLEASYIVMATPAMAGAGGMLNITHPDTWKFLAWQACKCSLRVLSWGLLAWAILKQPNLRIKPHR